MTGQLAIPFDTLPCKASCPAKRRPVGAIRPSRACNTDLLPQHWGERPLSTLARINERKLADTTDPDYEIEYIDIGNVDMVGGVQSTERYRFEDAPSRARRRVMDGDTIISTVRTYLKAVARIANPPENLIASTGFAVLSPRADCDPGFLFRLVQSEPFVQKVVAHSVGVSYPAINAPEIGKFLVPVPPVGEQQRIAAFLDCETARIDQLIGEKTRLIDLLVEKRAAIITHAVTKGLETNVKMKPTGIEWLGMVPEHFSFKRVKYVATILRGKFTHRPRNDPRMYDGPYPFVQTGDISAANKYIREYHQTLSDDGFAVSKMFPKGTLVMSIAANIGDMAILDFEACFPDSIVGFVPKRDVNLNFLFYLFTGMRSAFFSTATLNTQLNLNIERIGSLLTVVPSPKKQLQIVEFLDETCQRIDTIVEQIRAAASRLHEYRSALITAAVTGRIDVRANEEGGTN